MAPAASLSILGVDADGDIAKAGKRDLVVVLDEAARDDARDATQIRGRIKKKHCCMGGGAQTLLSLGRPTTEEQRAGC
jgi:hypothetical protein